MAGLSEMTDAQIVRLVLGGQRSAYGELVQRHSARLLAICRAHVASAEAAQDLAQEALLRGLQALPSLTEAEKFPAWLRGIAVRACLDWRKAKQSGQVHFSSLDQDDERQFEVVDDAPSAESVLESADSRQQLLRAIDQLPLEYREVLLLYYYDDVTYQQLADLLSVSRATINLRLSKARAMLREALSRSLK